MIATSVQTLNPLAFLGELMAPSEPDGSVPTEFAGLLNKLNLRPQVKPEAEAGADSTSPQTLDQTLAAPDDDEDDKGPVPKGLEAVANTLASALSAVLAAANKAVSSRSASAPPEKPVDAVPAPTVPAPIMAGVLVPDDPAVTLTVASAPIVPPAAEPTAAFMSISASGRTAPDESPADFVQTDRKPVTRSMPNGHFVAKLAATSLGASATPARTSNGAETPASAPDAVSADVAPVAPLVALATAAPSWGGAAAPVAAPLPTQAAPPSFDPSAIQPQSAPDIIIGHHLDMARDDAWLDHLARDIARAAQHDSQLRFQLNPEHLGSLHVELANTAEGTSIRLSANTEAARTILADAQPRLIAEARAQGLRISEAQIDLGGHGNQQRGHQENPHPAVRTVRATDKPADKPDASAERYA